MAINGDGSLTGNSNGVNGRTLSALKWMLGIMVTILLTITTLFINRVDKVVDRMEIRQDEMATDIAVIKSNRFTSSDGLDIWQEIYTLQRQCAEFREEIRDQ